MSMQVTQNGRNVYLVSLHYPEITWLRETAKAMSIPTDAVLAAAIGYGLPHYAGMACVIHAQNKEQNDKEKESDNGKKTESQGNGS